MLKTLLKQSAMLKTVDDLGQYSHWLKAY